MIKLKPHAAELVRRVYDSILGESWFNRNAITERELLKLILRHHASHGADEAGFLGLCRDEARARFSTLR